MTMKRILITQSQLRNYSGSEIVTLELIEHFTQEGWDVTVFTHYLDDPIKSDIEACAPRIITASSSDSAELDPKDFDVVWIHHHTITSDFLRKLDNTAKKPTVIFHHMSSSEPLEAPLFFSIEKKLAHCIAYNSQETQHILHEKMGIQKNIANEIIFDNPAPDRFLDSKSSLKEKDTLERVAVISNHPPEEVLAAVELLKDKGVSIDVIGRKGGEITRVTPDLLTDYDAVVTIGKTVQYGIAANIPVYCYDRFGGPGFINTRNYDKAHWHNFSGRGYSKKTARAIMGEISGNYSRVRKEFSKVHESYASDFILSRSLEKILHPSRQKNILKVSETELYNISSYLDVMQRIFPLYCKQIHYSEMKIADLQDNNKQLSQRLDHLNKENNLLQDQLASFHSSLRFKVGNAILAIPSHIKRKIKK